jgi:hypothetical protein
MLSNPPFNVEVYKLLRRKVGPNKFPGARCLRNPRCEERILASAAGGTTDVPASLGILKILETELHNQRQRLHDEPH